VRTVIDENADLLGFSVLTLGNHVQQLTKIMELLKKEGAGDVVVIGGGIMPPEDIEQVKAAGVSAIYPPGTMLPKAVEEMRSLVLQRRPVAA
jgi:methylmalonyl-CoA mutase cobalamin-binding domain/chain